MLKHVLFINFIIFIYLFTIILYALFYYAFIPKKKNQNILKELNQGLALKSRSYSKTCLAESMNMF